MILRERYELTPLGRGGQGQVFLAKDLRIAGKEWVAKQIPMAGGDPNSDPEVMALKLSLFGLPRLAEAFADNGSLWIVRDHVLGTSLEDLRLNQGGRFSRDVTIDLANKIGRILGSLHGAGLLVIDVKPANFIRTIDGRVVLIDAGSVTRAGNRPNNVTGTRGYVAPEVATGATLTTAADVFGLAETIVWMQTGDVVSPDPPASSLASVGILGQSGLITLAQALRADPDARPSLIGLLDALIDQPDQTCASCGQPMSAGKGFCGRCGATMTGSSIMTSTPPRAPSGPSLRVRTDIRKPRTLAAAIERRSQGGKATPPDLARLWRLAEGLAVVDGFESLIAVERANIDSYEHQRIAALRILREFRGSGVLADEVGLGKTIEAGIVLNELLARDLATRVLVLTPPHLTTKWAMELSTKFNDSSFIVCGGPGNWGTGRLIASHQQAVRQWFVGGAGAHSGIDPSRLGGRGNPYACVCSCRCGSSAPRPYSKCDQCAALSERILRTDVPEYDVVIVDEAHHAYRSDGTLTRLGELIAGIRRRYLLLLTATPVRHDIRELFQLISLVRPGEFKSLRDFEARVADPLQAGSSRQAAIGRLQTVLTHVMVRQRRRDIRIAWPSKQVYRQVVALSSEDRRLRDETLTAARAGRGIRARELAVAAYSSPQAAASRMGMAPPAQGSKIARLIRVLASRPAEKVIVFCAMKETMGAVIAAVTGAGRVALVYQGEKLKKLEVVRRFRDQPAAVLVADRSLSEGSDLQFAHVLVMFDVPWNPYDLEQMVGRVYRIGQTSTVEIHPIVSDDGVDLELWNLYEKSLQMFDRQVGELDAILSELDDDLDFTGEVWKAIATTSSQFEVRDRLVGLRTAIDGALAEMQAEERFLESMGLL
jgi:superfamily II DNA or RNA helicase